MVQFLLFILYLYNPYKSAFSGDYLNDIGLVAFVLGLVILSMAIYGLRKSLSPFPSPRKNAVLIQHGIFKYIRHPIYTSLLLCTFGWPLYSNSIFRMIIFTALALLFQIKSNFEESLLMNRFKDYQQYKKITGKFFPKIY